MSRVAKSISGILGIANANLGKNSRGSPEKIWILAKKFWPAAKNFCRFWKFWNFLEIFKNFRNFKKFHFGISVSLSGCRGIFSVGAQEISWKKKWQK